MARVPLSPRHVEGSWAPLHQRAARPHASHAHRPGPCPGTLPHGRLLGVLLPLRLVFADPKGGPILRAGMSAVIEIDTEHEASLPGFVKEALAWVNGGE